MKYIKTIALIFLGCLLVMGSTFFAWYNYPNAKLSMFLSGNGNAWFDIKYNNFNNSEKINNLYLDLTIEPKLYTVELKLAEINKLQFDISHYEGTINISDVFLNGVLFKNLQPQDIKNVNILNQSSNNLSFIMSYPTMINVCENCFKPQTKKFKPFIFSIILLSYVLLCIIGLLGHIFKEKIKNTLLTVYTLKNYALILPYAKPYWGRALLAVLITIPVGSMDAVIAWSLKPFMDVVLVEKQTGWTMYIPIMIVVFSILQALFTYLATYMNTWVGNKIALDVKKKLFYKLLHRDAAFFDKSNSGEILTYYNRDAEKACSGLLNDMKLFATRFFSSLSLIIVLFYNSWQLAIIAVIVMFGALYPLTRVRKRLKKSVKQDTSATATVFTNYNEAFSGNRIITSFNLFDMRKKKFVNAVNNVFNISISMLRKTGVISPVMHFISSFGIAFVIWYGSYLIVTHQITVGNFASFITSLVMLYNPLKSIGNNYSNVIFSLMAVERVFKKLNMVESIRNSQSPKLLNNCRGNINYKNVSFSYTNGKEVLHNINLDIKPGQTIALVGNSGGGKSTIAALLPRFYDVTGGSIEIDGINIKNYDLYNLRDNISIVFQDNFLFGGSIRDNILLGRKDIKEETLHHAIKSACLDEFINSLDDGLDTIVGERGSTLSGGQKQRVAIARAFIKNAPILILDEATSALDNKSEAVVQKAINNLMKNRTVLIIAHRLSTIKNADNIVVLNQGKIVEQGTHEELLALKKEYAALYKTQIG